MANATFTILGARLTATAAATATALGGGVVTSDVAALGAILTALATYYPHIMNEMIKTTGGPGGTALTTQLTPA